VSTDLRISSDGLRAPRYWPTWLLWKTLRLTHALPLRWHRRIGAAIGALSRFLFVRQRKIVRINLELCFPELPHKERDRLLREHFGALGMSILEMGIAWFSPLERIRGLVEVHGFEHLQNTARSGRAVLLWSAHSTCLEIGLRFLEELETPCAGMYHEQRNDLMARMLSAGRSHFADEQIPRDNVRALLSRLKQGFTVIYLPEQTYVGNQSALLPFFGEPAVTNIAASRIALRTDAEILTYFFRRLPGDAGYRIDIGPPLEGIPSTDALADARRLFAALERHIRAAPEQYLWSYKKFKRRPAPFADPYRDASER
jgi:KDO2-lipid IV(A) lauroyltransferase